jgi:hypothetical protein
MRILPQDFAKSLPGGGHVALCGVGDAYGPYFRCASDWAICQTFASHEFKDRDGQCDNHGISGALKNAIDFLFREWNDKAAGFVSYGGVGGARAVEQLRLVMAEVQIATVRNQALLSMFTDFENFSVFKPAPNHEKSVNAVFDQVIAWGGALKALRGKQA